VQVGIAILLKFENRDVLDREPTFDRELAEIHPKFIEDTTQVAHGLAVNLLGIERQRQKFVKTLVAVTAITTRAYRYIGTL
jgi:hypothetical protein